MEQQNCRDCVYIGTLSKRIDKVEENIDNIEKRLANLETNLAASIAANNEKFDSLHKMLEDIRNNLDKIDTRLQKIETKPSEIFWSIAGAVISGIILAVFQLLK